jgi:hypothetical protein
VVVGELLSSMQSMALDLAQVRGRKDRQRGGSDSDD